MYGIVLGITYVVQKRVGGTWKQGMSRSTLFLLATWGILQVFLQIGKLQSPYLTELNTILSFLNFEGSIVPSACTTVPPFLKEWIIQSILLLICILYGIVYSRQKWCNITNGIAAALFAIYGPVITMVFQTFPCVYHDANDKYYVRMLPTLECREGPHAGILTLSVLVVLIYFVGFPVITTFFAKRKANELVSIYNIQYQSCPLAVSKKEWALHQRIEKDERFGRESYIQPISAGVYTTPRSLWKLMDLGLLTWIAGLQQFFEPTYWTAALQSVGIILFLCLLMIYNPYKSETGFLRVSRGIVLLAAMMSILFRVIPGVAKSSFAGLSILLVLCISFIALTVSYVYSLIGGARKEVLETRKKRDLLGRLLHLWRNSPPELRHSILQLECQKVQWDCMDSLLEMLDTTMDSDFCKDLQKIHIHDVVEINNPIFLESKVPCLKDENAHKLSIEIRKEFLPVRARTYRSYIKY